MPLTDLVHYLNTRNREQYGLPLTREDALINRHDHILGRFADLNLSSVFQPIVDTRSGRVSGHEALLRAHTAQGQPLSPEAVFVLPSDATELVFLDRLCRTLHTLNFLLQNQRQNGYLYLNVHPRHLLAVGDNHGLVFETILKRCGVTPDNVVLEILESAIDDSPRLAEAVSNYRDRGYRIAVDDFGRHSSNFDRLWQLSPDVVKIDRHLLVRAEQDDRARRLLPKLVELVHELNARVVIEGVETENQLALALGAGADQVQGFYLARPAPHCLAVDAQLVNRDIRLPFLTALPEDEDGPPPGKDDLPHIRSAWQAAA